MNIGAEWVKYQLKSKNAHGIHSPFVFELYNFVTDTQRNYYSYEEIEEVRAALVESDEVIPFQDFGAGSKKLSGSERKVRDIAKASLKKPKYAQLLHRLLIFLETKRALELGTSLGVTTAYLAKAVQEELITIEGDPATSSIAIANLKQLQISNTLVVNNTFDKAIPTLTGQFDLIFIDGHHHGPSVLKYLELLAPYMSDDVCVIVDDIRWSDDMFQAWQTLIGDQQFHVSLDFFELGMLFKKPTQAREHFMLRY
ncbi:MAG: class I SAM-dependent methyltransferase [Flavobacteriales bacterium]|nr:class I SAM-dependent methyltransferase [Flavobacteriales bacterium]